MPSPAPTPSFDTPLFNLNELILPSPRSIPELFKAHRQHHGSPIMSPIWLKDREAWQSLSPEQAGVLVHVLSRFTFGMETALKALPLLELAAAKGGRENTFAYEAVRIDTRYVADACRLYQQMVADVQADPGSYTPNYRVIFTELFPARVESLRAARAEGNRTEEIKAEARLRTLYHVIGEGLGSITGIWGMNAALRELSTAPRPIDLLGLKSIVGYITLIQRRHIAFGLHEMGELAKERFFPTVRSVVAEFKADKPILDGMRSETFNRWGSQFPFAIDKEELAALGKRRVLSWVGSYVLIRPNGMPRKQLTTLAGVV